MKPQVKKKPIKTIFSKVPVRSHEISGRLNFIKKVCLPLPYWFLAHLHDTPGLAFYRYILQFALRIKLSGRGRTAGFHEMMKLPMDSVRYFEFNFMWKSLIRTKIRSSYLDVSSPRVFSLMVLHKFQEIRATIVNPDIADLRVTEDFFCSCGFSQRCDFLNVKVADLPFAVESFDLISCISVIEHIPGDGDRMAIEKIWSLLRPGGTLLVSVPCARSAVEEFININEYNLLSEDDDGYVFGQRFYDENLLYERILSITGSAVRMSIYGEKESGFFIKNREQKLCDPSYPFWREPYMMGKNSSFYESINDLPGWGVVAMEFRK